MHAVNKPLILIVAARLRSHCGARNRCRHNALSVTDPVGVGSMVDSGAGGFGGLRGGVFRGTRLISPADSLADVSTADFIGLGAASDFMTPLAATTDVRAIRSTITSIASISGVMAYLGNIFSNPGNKSPLRPIQQPKAQPVFVMRR